eukprot:1070584-Prymnesium_polylepis.1
MVGALHGTAAAARLVSREDEERASSGITGMPTSAGRRCRSSWELRASGSGRHSNDRGLDR